MKKIISMTIALAAVITLAGCGGAGEVSSSSSSSTTSSRASSSEIKNESTSSASETTSSSSAETSSSSSSETSSSLESSSSDEIGSSSSSEPQTSSSSSEAPQSSSSSSEEPPSVGADITDRELAELYVEYNYNFISDFKNYTRGMGNLWGMTMGDTFDSFITGEFHSSIEYEDLDPSTNYSLEELQAHFKYCMLYGFENMRDGDKQIHSDKLYKNYLAGISGNHEHFYLPSWSEIAPDFSFTRKYETINFGDGLKSQITLTICDSDKDSYNIYYTVINGEYKFLDFKEV